MVDNLKKLLAVCTFAYRQECPDFFIEVMLFSHSLVKELRSMKREISHPVRYDKDVVDFESFSNIFSALTHTSGESLLMEARYNSLIIIQKTVMSWNVTLDTAAERLGIQRSKLADILCCQLHKFSIDELATLAALVKSMPMHKLIPVNKRL